MKKFLLITYYFPPAPMAYSQRVAKLCKYIEQTSNWRPIVLCGKLPAFIPGKDFQLEKEIPANVKVISSGSFISSSLYYFLNNVGLKKILSILLRFFFFPDNSADWINKSFKNFIKEEIDDIEAVFVSGPPRSAYVLGLRIANKLKIPLIIDMRDPWLAGKGNQLFIMPWFRKKLINIEMEIYNESKFIICNSIGNKLELTKKFPELSPKIVVVENGFDIEDIKEIKGPGLVTKNLNKIQFLYLGGIRGNDFDGIFFKVVAQYLEKFPYMRNKIFLNFVGGNQEEVSSLAKLYDLEEISHGYGVVQCNEIGKPLLQSDICIVILPDDIQEAQGRIPAKIFYYLISGKPIFGILPEGAAKKLIINEAQNFIEISSPSDINVAVQNLSFLIKKVEKNRDNSYGFVLNENLMEYERKNISKKIGQLLTNVSSKP